MVPVAEARLAEHLHQLLGHEHLTPGITTAEYWQHRHRLAALMAPGSVAILPAAPIVYMAGIIPYPAYRPDPDLMYMTGFMQQGVVAVIQSAAAEGDRHPVLVKVIHIPSS